MISIRVREISLVAVLMESDERLCSEIDYPLVLWTPRTLSRQGWPVKYIG